MFHVKQIGKSPTRIGRELFHVEQLVRCRAHDGGENASRETSGEMFSVRW
jgi:hypothetical protein